METSRPSTVAPPDTKKLLTKKTAYTKHDTTAHQPGTEGRRIRHTHVHEPTGACRGPQRPQRLRLTRRAEEPLELGALQRVRLRVRVRVRVRVGID
jgi:hypothetical protein